MLARSHPFTLLCGYIDRNPYREVNDRLSETHPRPARRCTRPPSWFLLGAEFERRRNERDA